MEGNQLKHSYYPLFLNIQGKNCVVVGGGVVASRKVSSLLECGAYVTVISRSVCSELRRLSETNKINLLLKDFGAEDIKDAVLIIAATDKNDVNEYVAAEARKGNILVNVVDNARQSDFIVPASLFRGDLTISIATAGKSPALARKIKRNMEKIFGKEYGVLVDLVSEVRSEMKKRGISAGDDQWQKALDLDLLLHLLKSGQKDKAKSILQANLLGPVDG